MQKLLKIESEIQNMRIVERIIDEISAELNISQDNYGKIMVSTMEAVNNAIIHGNKSDKNKYVVIRISGGKHLLKVSIEDEGTGFRPKEIPDPTKPENIENISGRGVFLMSKLADNIEFNEKGNRVTLLFKDNPT
jgi:serine/threonine-protein kinase RsbW